MRNSYESKYYELKNNKSRAMGTTLVFTVILVFLGIFLLYVGIQELTIALGLSTTISP